MVAFVFKTIFVPNGTHTESSVRQTDMLTSDIQKKQQDDAFA